MIWLTKHAKEKFEALKRHGFMISQREVIKTVEQPEMIDYGRLPLLIAQRKIDNTHVLRVVYKIVQKDIKIITFYPGRLRQYEKK